VPSNDTTLHTASVPISLPSYQSQMAGAIQPCVDNQCGMIKVETFPEGIIKRLHVAKKDVATFSSWPEIAYAVEHIKGATYTNTGNKPVYDPEYLKADSVMKDLNQKQTLDHPRGHDRYDRYTFAQAWHYFDKYKPRFMWIALNDADEAAHAGNIQTYHQALAYYDGALDTVLKYLKERGIDKETMVIVTTDHGRGNGKNWTMHDPKFPESRQIWAFIINGQLVPATNEETKGHFSLLSIRPTVESALY
jgi:arylsulfatase A-like enzyme